MKQKFIIYSILLFLIIGCSQNKYEIAKSLHKNEKYALAINFYDQFINHEERGAKMTEAELSRSQCYLELGKIAYEKEDWILANRLFYLSNSEEADSFMDNCYYELAKEAIEINQINVAMEHFEFVLTYLKNSELIPEILFNRLNIYFNQGKKLLAYDDFNTLATTYPENDFTQSAQKIIDKNMDYYLQNAKQYAENDLYSVAIEKLLYLEKNPSIYKQQIKNELADVYIRMADSEIEKKNYIRAKRFFETALEWDISVKNIVDEKLNDIVELFITKGDELIRAEKIEEAIANYREVFDIIADHPLAKKRIANAEQIKENYDNAKELIAEAKELEKNKQFVPALAKYQQSNQLHKLKTTSDNIARVKNLIEAEKDPIGFARRIIIGHQDGLIAAKIIEIERNLQEMYGETVNSSGWKVLYAFGEYKYEIRYDITSPEKNYYFVWRVDLVTEEVLPLNKISEEILTVR